jgi:hypothetical protein
LAVCGALALTRLLASRPAVFLGMWVLSLAIAGARVPGIAVVSVGIRYALMLAMVGMGLQVAILGGLRLPSGSAWLGLCMLSYELLHAGLAVDRASAFAMLPMQIAIYIGILVGFGRLLESKPSLERDTGLALAGAGVLTTIVNLFGVFTAEGAFLDSRLRSWYALPTGFADGFSIALLPVLWLAMNSRSRLLYRASALVTVIVGGVLLVLSGTRAAAIVSIVAIAMLAWYCQRRIIPILLFGIIIGGALSVAGDWQARSRLTQVSTRETRFLVWKQAWSRIEEHPIAGHGLGRQLTAVDPDSGEVRLLDAHNAYLGIALQLGAIGVFLVGTISACAAFMGLRLASTRRRIGGDQGLAALYLTMLVGVLLAGMFESNLYGRGSIHQAAWAIAVTMLSNPSARLRGVPE